MVHVAEGSPSSTSTGRDPSPRRVVRVEREDAILGACEQKVDAGVRLQEREKKQQSTDVIWADLFC